MGLPMLASGQPKHSFEENTVCVHGRWCTVYVCNEINGISELMKYGSKAT
jgi:hypothetical protein